MILEIKGESIMNSKLIYRILAMCALATLLLSGCNSSPQAIKPVNDSEKPVVFTPTIQTGSTLAPTQTLMRTTKPNFTPEPTQISYPVGLGTPLPRLTEKISAENAADIVEIARWDVKSVRTFTFAPDGQSLLVGTTNGELMIIPISDSSSTQTLAGHTKAVTSVTYSSDGQYIISGSLDKTVRIWNAEDGSVVNVLEGHDDGITSIAISRDGQTIASGAKDDTVRIWKFNDGKLLQIIKGDFTEVRSLAFAADGTTLAFSCQDLTARIWDIVSGVQIQKLESKTLRFGADDTVDVTYSPDGTLLGFRHSFSGKVMLYNTSDYSVNAELPVPGLKNSRFVFSSDGGMLITGAQDSGLNFVNIKDGATLKNIALKRITWVASSPDGTLVAVTGSDYVIHLWGIQP
jgi:WD40 repeat protein